MSGAKSASASASAGAGEGGRGARELRIGAVGDFHCGGHEDPQELTELFARAARECDVLLLAGDMTTHGEPDQMRRFVDYIADLSIPKLAVLGNHDLEKDNGNDLCAILQDGGIKVLDGEGIEIDGVGFVGVKGFGGGFGRFSLGTFGERETKAFVDAVIAEQLKLERGLAALRTETKVVLLHYSPVAETMGDEPPQIWPFLGSSRLLTPIETYGAAVVFHGHAHIGVPEARTPAGIPVYNVALPVLRKAGVGLRVWTTKAPDRRGDRA